MAKKSAKPVEKKAAKAAAEGPSVSDLRKLPAFSGMSAEDAALFLSVMSPRTASNGVPILREGTPGDGLFVILDGSVAITRNNAKGGERDVAILEKGEVFGEMDLISDRPHTSGAKGRAGVKLLFLPKKAFQDLLRAGNPGAASLVLYFARMLAGRLDANNRRMMEMLEGNKEARGGSEFAEFKRRLLREWSF